MKIIKHILIITLIAFAAVIITGCNAEENHPESPIFSGVDLIESNYDGNFNFELPSEAEFVILGIFANEPIEVSGRNLADESQLLGGNRTGLPNIDRNSATSVYIKTGSGENIDFDKNTTLTLPTPFNWAVWGIDADRNVICASGPHLNTTP